MSDEIVREIFALFETRGSRSYGENVSMTDHMLQSAALANRDGERESLIIACLLHDIGHFLHDEPEDAAERGRDTRHEDLGADYLKRFFPPEITEPVRLHVAAKRYLYTVEADYGAELSPASRLSLQLQGGALRPEEVESFRASPHYEDAVKLRKYDEDGKVRGLRITPLAEYAPLMRKFARRSP